MWVQVACEALRSGHVLELRYDGYSRSVEVHAVGFTKEDNAVMRVWQVSGGSVSNEPVGWKLLRLDEATEAVVTKQKSLAPRPGYKPGDPVNAADDLPVMTMRGSPSERTLCEVSARLRFGRYHLKHGRSADIGFLWRMLLARLRHPAMSVVWSLLGCRGKSDISPTTHFGSD